MDRVSVLKRSKNMAAIKSAATKPEKIVRRIVRSSGFRFSSNVTSLPGKPDLVFPSIRKAIFIHGCFWHQHAKCSGGHIPKSNATYWRPKLLGNKRRDKANRAKLTKLGWKSLVLWECAIKKQEKLENSILMFLKGR